MADEPGGVADLFDFTFTKFVTPTVVRIIYLLIVVFVALGWLFGVIAGFSQGGLGGGLAAIIFVSLGSLIALLVWRVILEITMVVFRIKENTDNLASGSGG